MKRTILLLAFIIPMIFPSLGTFAQDAGDGPTRVEFEYGDFLYDLDPSVAVNACVVRRDQTLGYDHVTLRLFGRTLGQERFVYIGELETERTEDIEGRPVGYCIPLGEKK